jgi:hypothetical protein
MKRIIVTVALAITVIAGAWAQTAQIKIKAREAEIPVAVVESFKKDFATGHTTEWAIVPATVVGDEYIVSGYDDLNGEKPTYYSVLMKGPKIKGEAVYDQYGKLKHSKEVIKDTALPDAVRNSVMREYPGYAFLKDQEIIKEGKTKFVQYRVLIEKGKAKKALAVDANGKILKEKRVLV